MENSPHRSVSGGLTDVPKFMYGTAWKENQTRHLTELALTSGFRAVDTANQRRHYDEAAVGDAVEASIERGLLVREDLFLQTKFTFHRGQDHRLPYDPAASISTQVLQSFESSLRHLRTHFIDSYLLHGPSQRNGLGPDDWEAWHAMEEICESGRVKMLGISNVTCEQLQTLSQAAGIRPCFVQNRCYAVRGWDRQVRQFCSANHLIYQGFSLLTANSEALSGSELVNLSDRYNRSVSQIVFRFALEIGILPLTGTTDARHMREDLDIFNFCLTSEEVQAIEHLAG